MPAATKRRGFTLIELMIVVVLVGIMTAMIIPEMKGTFEDALLRSTARKLVNILNLAYSQAVTVSQPHRVRLDRKSGHYVMERTAREGEGDGGFVPVRNVIGSEGELDTRISIDIRNPDEDQAPATDPDSSSAPREDAQKPARSDFISFNPDGTADDKEIILRDREGFRLALRINPTTARVRIIEAPRE